MLSLVDVVPFFTKPFFDNDSARPLETHEPLSYDMG